MDFTSLTLTTSIAAFKLAPVAQKAFPVINNVVLNAF